MLLPKIQTIASKKMVGTKLQMCLAENKTALLWQTFMPQHKTVAHRKGTDLYAIQYYAKDTDFISVDPYKLFESWAAVEVESFEAIPTSLSYCTLVGGLYAVFTHEGIAATILQTLTSIFTQWLPDSSYQLDNRAHFMLMAEDYSPNDPKAKEQIWIPIKIRK